MPVSTLPRPAERVALVSFILVFLCGIATGAVVLSFLIHPGLHGSRPGAISGSMSVREWKQQLDLSDEQTRQLTSVLDDFAHYYDNLLADGNSRVRQILTPQQTQKYERMIREHKQ